jgi:hypothetical protein
LCSIKINNFGCVPFSGMAKWCHISFLSIRIHSYPSVLTCFLLTCGFVCRPNWGHAGSFCIVMCFCDCDQVLYTWYLRWAVLLKVDQTWTITPTAAPNKKKSTICSWLFRFTIIHYCPIVFSHRFSLRFAG